jgi:hypothetical protein
MIGTHCIPRTSIELGGNYVFLENLSISHFDAHHGFELGRLDGDTTVQQVLDACRTFLRRTTIDWLEQPRLLQGPARTCSRSLMANMGYLVALCNLTQCSTLFTIPQPIFFF